MLSLGDAMPEITKCHCCGFENSSEINEVYPLFPVEVSFPPHYKQAMLCHVCFNNIYRPLRMDHKQWRDISPVVDFNDLPEKIIDINIFDRVFLADNF